MSVTSNILVKEQYGVSNKQRLYVKPPDQSKVVVVERNNINIINWLISIFLPLGFPDSVSKDYITYQKWDTAQAFCSTITGVLATQEVLTAVGVGNSHATPLAATIMWIFKDGCGHIGRILFAYTHGSKLDAYSKRWRMYADILNNVAMCIEMALPKFGSYQTFALCLSTTAKSIVGVAGGATRAALTKHHAINGNLADVSAKDSAQETAVNLIASFVALLIISTIGAPLPVFILLMIMHITFNYLAVRAVCLRTLNETRFLLVIENYLKNGVIYAPCLINSLEPIIFYQMGLCILDLKMSGFKIKLGCSLQSLMEKKLQTSYLEKLCEVYIDRNYIIVPNIAKREMNVFLKNNADVDDVLCSYFHAVFLSIITCAINDEHLSIYKSDTSRPFAKICQILQSAEWSKHETYSTREALFTYDPSFELITLIDKVVNEEWLRVRGALLETGWDLSTHLIVTDQWRIDSGRLVTRTISLDSNKKVDCSQSSFNKMLPFENYEEFVNSIQSNTIKPESEEEDLKQTLLQES